jgi:hypothetical protein
MKRLVLILFVVHIACSPALARQVADTTGVLPELSVEEQIEEIETYTINLNWYGQDSVEGVRTFINSIRRIFPGLAKKKFVLRNAQMVFELYAHRPDIVSEQYRLVAAGAGQKYAVDVEYRQLLDLLVKDARGNIHDIVTCQQELKFKGTYNVSTMYRRITNADGTSSIRFTDPPANDRSGMFRPTRGEELRNIQDTLYWILQEKKNREKELAEM